MKKNRQEVENDQLRLLEGENLTAEQLDNASIEMLQNYTDFGLQCFAEQCRHWQAIPMHLIPADLHAT